jgi:hypothetical protein
MTPPAGARVGLVIGAIMVALGVYIALRVLATGAPPLTGALWLDLAFGFFFVVRGALAYARWRRARDASG